MNYREPDWFSQKAGAIRTVQWVFHFPECQRSRLCAPASTGIPPVRLFAKHAVRDSRTYRSVQIATVFENTWGFPLT